MCALPLGSPPLVTARTEPLVITDSIYWASPVRDTSDVLFSYRSEIQLLNAYPKYSWRLTAWITLVFAPSTSLYAVRYAWQHGRHLEGTFLRAICPSFVEYYASQHCHQLEKAYWILTNHNVSSGVWPPFLSAAALPRLALANFCCRANHTQLIKEQRPGLTQWLHM